MKKLLVVILAALLSACSTTYVKPASAEQQAVALKFEAIPNKAVIYFYRDGWMGGDNKTGLYIDKLRVATGAAGAYSRIEVGPGTRRLDFTQVVSAVQLEDPGMTIDKELKSGELYFIEEKWVFANGFNWVFVDASAATSKINNLQLNLNVGRIDGLK